MPGLAAIISPSPSPANGIDLERMVQSMNHEAFYKTGTYTNAELGVCVGWVCHPGSSADSNPVRSVDGNLILFFYGEHLHDAGDNQTTDAGCSLNAQVVLGLFAKYGKEALRHLNGWFHGILLDVRNKEILVFNDRFGMQHLYTSEADGVRLFASEAKALLSVRPQLRRIDAQGLAEFLTCGCILENRSLFTAVRSLPAATVWTFWQDGKAEESRYFSPEEWERQDPMKRSEFYTSLRDTLQRAVRRCISSDLPIGISLTGGFDTRLIMGYLSGDGSPLAAYTFGSMYRDCFDVKIARKVAEISGCSHRVLELGEDFLREFPALAEKTVYLSDGCLGATNAYELYLNRRARQTAPVRLTGSLGSEVMRGARAFKAKPPTPGLVHPDFAPYLEKAIGTFDDTSRGNKLSFSVFRQAPWSYFNRLAVEQSQVIVRTPFMDKDLVRLMYRCPDNPEEGRALARRLIAERNEALAALPTDTGNCSYLRQKFSEFLFKADYCYKSGMPQWLEQLHYLLGPLQPQRFIIGTHRFAHFRVWFRGQLASYLQDVLFDPRTRTRSYFNQSFVAEMLARHLKGDRNYTDDIERVLTVELACRSLVDN